jgi:hypothetical protein
MKSSLNTLEIPYLDSNNQPTTDPDQATQWQMVTDPIQIEDQLLSRNIAHFGQAEGTLFTKRHFQQRFGYTGVANTTNDLLTGTRRHTHDDNMTTGATTLLDLPSNKANLDPIDDNVDIKSFRSAFRK